MLLLGRLWPGGGTICPSLAAKKCRTVLLRLLAPGYQSSGARSYGAQPHKSMGFQKEDIPALTLLELWLHEAVTVEMANTLGVSPCQLTDHTTIDRVTAEILPRVALLLRL